MRALLLIAAAILALATQPPAPRAGQQVGIKADVDRLVAAAETLTDTWPKQPAPPVPEVAAVARHGRPAIPLLLALLSDDPAAERDTKRWKVQQQASLALSAIYGESEYCGRTYCDGDSPERSGRIKSGWLSKIAADEELRRLGARELLDRFTREPLFWRQMEIAQALAEANDRSVISDLEPWLKHQDRHLRGNAAFVLGKLGDPRGFATIVAILADRSERPEGQGISGITGTPDAQSMLRAQIRADRYYAAHLVGDLKDPRGVDVLVPLLNDDEVMSIVPWSLGQIGDARPVPALIAQLDRNDPSTRVVAILALQKLNAQEALPRLRELLRDPGLPNFGDRVTVGESAKRAIATLSPATRR